MLCWFSFCISGFVLASGVLYILLVDLDIDAEFLRFVDSSGLMLMLNWFVYQVL